MPDLYHYCSTETFVSIISSRTIRLSSLTMSNDSKEGTLIRDCLMQVAQEAQLYPIMLGNFERALQLSYEVFDGLGFCLSENGDLLSQWRGYADDGRGLSLGFSGDYLEKLRQVRLERDEISFSLKKLIYDESKHSQIAASNFEKLKPLIDRGAFRSTIGSLLSPLSEDEQVRIMGATNDAYLVLFESMLRMFEVKHPAFKEELEWRLISLSSRQPDNPRNRYRACIDKIVPYLEVPLEDVGRPAISSVVLGPRHTTPPQVVKQLLHSAGFGEAVVTRSAATYR